MNLWFPGGREGWKEGTVREFQMGRYTLLCLRWITHRVLLHARETLLSVMWQPGWEGSVGKSGYEYMHG